MTTSQLLAKCERLARKLDRHEQERKGAAVAVPDKFIYDVCTFGRYWGMSAGRRAA